MIADCNVHALGQFDPLGAAGNEPCTALQPGPRRRIARDLDHGAFVDSVDMAGARVQRENPQDAGAASQVGDPVSRFDDCLEGFPE